MSLLFENRTSLKEEIFVHAGLCTKVLQTFLLVCKQKLQTETWEVILKLLLGMCDSLLNPSRIDELGNLLAERLLHVRSVL